ncbi:MAG TPA: hypothetical protein VNF51_00055 [Candidatus Paceibacterota bacterium]|nr:hypothetical protein [Candidatus Paceibacterota bacterium]
MDRTEINTSNRSETITTPNSSTVFAASTRLTTTIASSHRQAVMHTLAVVGFVALIGASMWLAIYSTRYVPNVVNRLGSAAVYLGSVFTPASPSLSVVPAASTTIPFGESSSDISTNIYSAIVLPLAPTKSIPTTGGEETSGAYPMGTTTATTPVISNGLPDFVVSINAIGYLATSSADSFIASSTVPAGSRPAVKFTIKNIGTNASGMWCWSASIPTQTAYIYDSQPQQSLNPGDSIDYTLGFDQANKGAGQTISITANIADPSNSATCATTVSESNSNNNSASAQITILGS